MKPAVIGKIIDTIQEKYDLEFVWCEDRDDMRKRMLEWFDEQEKIKNA